MAIVFPRSPAAFFDQLGFTAFQMSIPPIMETNETSGGEIISVEYGPQLWTGSATCRINPYDRGEEIVALFETMLRSDATFLAYDKLRQWPVKDYMGLSVASASPKVSPVSGNNRAVRLTGLPATYVLERGDLISFNYSTNPTRGALHRVATRAVGTSSGVIAELEVNPAIRPGLAADTDLKLVPAVCKAKITQYTPPTSSRSRRADLSFSWRQTLR